MGRFITVMKKREVEYGKTSAFNYGLYTLRDILDALFVEHHLVDDEDGDCAELRVDAESLKKGIEDLRKVKDGLEVSEDIDVDYLKDQITNELGYSLEDFIKVMVKFMAEGDCRNGYYYFVLL